MNMYGYARVSSTDQNRPADDCPAGIPASHGRKTGVMP